VRERGTQSRDARARRVETSIRRPGPPASRQGNAWQVVAIVALIVAAAGWTTVWVLASREPTTAAVESPDPDASFDESPADNEEIPPVADTHDALELEAVLPHVLKGSTLDLQSWTGDLVLKDDDTWSSSIKAFLTTVNKVPRDFRGANASDPNQVVEETLGVYRVTGVPAESVRDALIAAWKIDYPDLIVSQITLGGKTVTKLDFGEDTVDTYLYLRDDLVFDVETTDDAIATESLNALPAAGASSAPAPSGSTAPASKAPAPTASAS
jgi:hypothetical protein